MSKIEKKNEGNNRGKNEGTNNYANTKQPSLEKPIKNREDKLKDAMDSSDSNEALARAIKSLLNNDKD